MRAPARLANWATVAWLWAALAGCHLGLGLLSMPGHHGLEAASLGWFAAHYCSPNFSFFRNLLRFFYSMKLLKIPNFI
jgi:hypothetical protein